MKVLLFVVFLSLAIGAYAQTGSTEATTSEKIHQLQALVSKLEASVRRFVRIGKQNVAKLENVMNAVDERRRRCLTLETLRPAPIPFQPMTDIPIKPLEGDPLTLAQITNKIQALENRVQGIVSATTRYVSIGKNNIGLMQRFAEASRTAVCGPDHYSKCPMGFMHNAVSDSCFREVVGRFKSFSQAQDACHKRGAHLPRVETAAKNNALAGLLQLAVESYNPSDKVRALWLGLQRNAEGAWQWVHPEDAPVLLGDAYSNFRDAEDDDALRCAYLCTRSNSWIKTSCDIRTRILCERAKHPEPVADAAR